MLELKDISLALGTEPDDQALLTDLTVQFPQGHFAAIVGPSGSGKSTLLKVVAGLREQTAGTIHWQGRDVAEKDLDPYEVGYVPQFSIAYDLLTVEESVDTALRLRVAGLGADARAGRAQKILAQVGLHEIGDREVRVLSGGQKRRLALALELASSPSLLLCDEVTSGLDPKAEDEIVRLMKQLSRENGRIVLSVTHSLRHLDLYDSVLVLHQGHLTYHGPPRFVYHYFNLENPEDLFPRLTSRTPLDWHRSWKKHSAPYYEVLLPGEAPATPTEGEKEPAKPVSYETLRESFERSLEDENEPEETVAQAAPEPVRTPGALSQFFTLFFRRWRVFLRDRGQLLLHLALLFGFPCLVVVFAWDGLPQMQNLTMGQPTNMLEQLVEKTEFLLRSSKVGALVSGLVMFQVVLLTLMGSNNAAREIAGERQIFEKEKFGGVSPLSYVASKACFVAILVLAQSVWMGVFVKMICRFPGDLGLQLAFLILVNGAMTSTCLAISSLTRSAEHASLVSIYLVGFQLPLSGAVLALPELLARITQPFIASYWGWSGYLQTMRDTRHYDAVLQVTQTPLSNPALCGWVLFCHILLGIFLAWIGCRQSRWE